MAREVTDEPKEDEMSVFHSDAEGSGAATDGWSEDGPVDRADDYQAPDEGGTQEGSEEPATGDGGEGYPIPNPPKRS